MNRRRFLGTLGRLAQGAAAGAIGLSACTALRAGLGRTEPAPPGQHPLRPPGAMAEPAFRAACVRCTLCAEACHVGAIRFPGRIVGAQSPLPRGPGSLRGDGVAAPVWSARDTPYVLPWDTACNLCMRCGKACPTGALRPIEPEWEVVGQQVRMGTAVIDRKICLPWNRLSWCGACLTICPYRELAITVDHQNRPTIHPEHCVGCGLCVEVCPIRHKAVMVVPPFAPDRGEVRAE